MTRIWLLGLLIWFAIAEFLVAAEPAPDAWLEAKSAFPGLTGNLPKASTNTFGGFNAQFIAARLRVSLDGRTDATSVEVWHSTDRPGHWPSRDWSVDVADLRGETWQANVPIANVDVPLVYFARVVGKDGTNLSPMRICYPRRLGMEEPSRLYWAFLDGFEQGANKWIPMGGPTNTVQLRNTSASKNGKSVLSIRVPKDKRSAAAGTGLVRGWHIQDSPAYGLRVWVRIHQGTGKARFSLQSNMYTERQRASIYPVEIELSESWTPVELAFDQFPGSPLTEVDFFTVEFFAPGPAEMQLDDVELLGPWVAMP